MCLVMLKIISKKQHIINIMVFSQSYEENEIDKIRQIYGKDNPANTMTKRLPNLALKKIIIINKGIIRLER